MQPASDGAPFAIARVQRRRAAISLTPLIDVVFILLIFFMLASSFMDWRAIMLDAPRLSTASGGSEGALLVEVAAGDRGPVLRLAGERLTLEDLAVRIAERLSQDPQQRVLLRAGNGVALQDSVTILDRLDGLGVRDLALLPPSG